MGFRRERQESLKRVRTVFSLIRFTLTETSLQTRDSRRLITLEGQTQPQEGGILHITTQEVLTPLILQRLELHGFLP